MGGLNLEVFKVYLYCVPAAKCYMLRLALLKMMTSCEQDTDMTCSQFGTYVMFPIGIMFYFGTNLDNRFAVPGFWPKPEECNKIPKDRDEIKAEYERIVARQKLRQAKKLEEERKRAAQQPENDQPDS
jgi:protein PET100, fungi type